MTADGLVPRGAMESACSTPVIFISPTGKYRQTYNISRTLVGKNKYWLLRCSCSWSSVGAAPITSSFSTFGLNGLGKDNCKTRRETFKFWNLVQLILEVWR